MNTEPTLIDVILFPIGLILGVFLALLWVGMWVAGGIKMWMEEEML